MSEGVWGATGKPPKQFRRSIVQRICIFDSIYSNEKGTAMQSLFMLSYLVENKRVFYLVVLRKQQYLTDYLRCLGVFIDKRQEQLALVL